MDTNIQAPVFALDIGTRSVVGLILYKKDKKYEVVDIEIEEHDERSMLDGQIHNVLSVSQVITSIKVKLEEKHGPLKKVCVAAAGRSLKTKQSKIEIDISNKPLFEHNDILHLELSAVQQAQYELAQENKLDKSFNYYCVGYSVVSYKLDGEDIGSLLDQQGTIAAVEVIATFLPKVVVESLIAALQRSQLELEALTLEPIAAINVLIPPSMRRLNVALVDIGAGTSDIAITDLNTVIAYGMVPIAGDEITEAISDHFLLDFPDAESVKRQLSIKDEIVITDILGFETVHKKEEILEPIIGSIEQLASAITKEILALNHKSPKAVMLVGGGSMTPKLSYYVAQYLELPENRVAIRGIDAIKGLEFSDHIQAGPELVTPIGIAIAAKENPIQYISITVNDKTLRLFDIKALTIGDGLLAAGIEVSKLYGKPGSALMVKINDRLISIPGQHGKPPLILKNGEHAKLDNLLADGDHIIVKKGDNGEQAKATVQDVIETIPSLTVTINGERHTTAAIPFKNGKVSDVTDELEDRDEIVIKLPETIQELLYQLNLHNELQLLQPLTVFVNNKKVILNKSNGCVEKNGRTADLSTPIHDGDYIDTKVGSNSSSKVIDLLNQLDLLSSDSVTVFFNGEKLTLKRTLLEVKRNGTSIHEDTTLTPNDDIVLIEKERTPFIFQDIFREVEVDLQPKQNKRLLILKNGEDTTFSSQLTTGDELEVRWIPTSENVIL